MEEHELAYLAYLLRLRLIEYGDGWVWRATLEEPGSRKQVGKRLLRLTYVKLCQFNLSLV